MIPGLGRSPGGGIGSPLQYSWASLMPQTVKNLPAMQETWVLALGWKDPLGKSMATHSSILAWRIPMDRGAWWATVHGHHKELHTTERLSTDDSYGEQSVCSCTYSSLWSTALSVSPLFSLGSTQGSLLPEDFT